VLRDPCRSLPLQAGGRGRNDGEEAFFDTLIRGEGIGASGDAGGLLRCARNVRSCRGFLLTLLVCLGVLVGFPTHAQTVHGLQCGSFREVGRFSSPEIMECSGLVVSRKNPGILWVHNDSGDKARLFAVKEDGSLRGTFRLARADSEDWEDLALGPCRDSGKECLYVGDIGDNTKKRRNIQVYRVEEPTVPLDGPPVREKLKGTKRFDCTYPDGPHDAEALFVDPGSGIPYLITKEQGGSAASVYRFPGTSDLEKTITLEKVATLPGRSSVTGGDITQDGSVILLRDYFFAYGYFRPRRGGIPEAFDLPPSWVPLGMEAQGESLGFSPSGSEIYTASEGMDGPIHKAECTLVQNQVAPRGKSAGGSNGVE
jgi:hypothetical protein